MFDVQVHITIIKTQNKQHATHAITHLPEFRHDMQKKQKLVFCCSLFCCLFSPTFMTHFSINYLIYIYLAMLKGQSVQCFFVYTANSSTSVPPSPLPNNIFPNGLPLPFLAWLLLTPCHHCRPESSSLHYLVFHGLLLFLCCVYSQCGTTCFPYISLPWFAWLWLNCNDWECGTISFHCFSPHLPLFAWLFVYWL